jgi:hypothetical protein
VIDYLHLHTSLVFDAAEESFFTIVAYIGRGPRMRLVITINEGVSIEQGYPV